MRKFSVKPVLTMKGRTFKGLRGWSGKPLHPPLTDVPIGAYVLAAAFDAISVIGGDTNDWARDFWHAGTFALIGGALVSLPTALTGLVDRNRSSEAGTQARRTINTHAATMAVATGVVVANIVWRLAAYDTEVSAPVGIMVLSVLAAGLTAFGATFGGSLVFEHGFNVETAGDDPVWHRSETDVFPGRH